MESAQIQWVRASTAQERGGPESALEAIFGAFPGELAPLPAEPEARLSTCGTRWRCPPVFALDLILGLADDFVRDCCAC
jgi:hypothetical protein